jgi:hypothetical protein
MVVTSLGERERERERERESKLLLYHVLMCSIGEKSGDLDG